MPMRTVSMKTFIPRVLLTTGLVLLIMSARVPAQESNRPTVNLNAKLPEFQTVKPNWAIALLVLLHKTNIPYLLELDTLTYRDMSVRDKLGLFTGSEQARLERGTKWATAFKVDLKNVTVKDALNEILKDQPRYTYDLVENARCLHIFPRGIQERKEWPLNQPVPEFSISQEQINRAWYRKVFGVFLLKYQIHIGEFNGGEFAQSLNPQMYHDVSLRKLLTELSATYRVGWIVEPFPEEEIEFREVHNKEYYERGYDIGRPGSNNWYQIHYSFLDNRTPSDSAQSK
jgi:hypothetical protein